jgi:hypothetical protein
MALPLSEIPKRFRKFYTYTIDKLVVDLLQLVDDINEWIGALNTELVAMQAEIDAIDLAAIEADILALQGDVTAIQSDVTIIQGDITSIVGDVTIIQGDITSIQGDITTIQGDIVTINNTFTALNNYYGVLAKAAGYNVVPADRGKLINVTAAGAVTITLDATLTAIVGAEIGIKKINDDFTNHITVDPAGGATIDGAATHTLYIPKQTVWYRSDGTNWYIVQEFNTVDVRTVTSVVVERHANGLMRQRASSTGCATTTAAGSVWSGDETIALAVAFVGTPYAWAVVSATGRWADARSVNTTTLVIREFSTGSSATVQPTKYEVAGNWR